MSNKENAKTRKLKWFYISLTTAYQYVLVVFEKGRKLMFDRYLQHPKCVAFTFLCNVLLTSHYEWLLNLARTCFLYCKMCMISENEIIYHNQTCYLISFNHCTYNRIGDTLTKLLAWIRNTLQWYLRWAIL